MICSHEEVDSEQVWDNISSGSSCDRNSDKEVCDEEGGQSCEAAEPHVDEDGGIITLKFEPFILHVQCRNLDVAKTLHTLR